jgi:ABC-type cobalamin/Fe3+-siderophores transport system ATPase subunit
MYLYNPNDYCGKSTLLAKVTGLLKIIESEVKVEIVLIFKFDTYIVSVVLSY